MGKIKLNLPTGISVDKSLINCFKADNTTYAIFDADSVGSMGLPIILVSKYENNRLTKILNADEWTKVKGYLKEIISGIKKEFLQLNSSLDADEVFYTQLTLPVASFDSLKRVYSESLSSSMINNGVTAAVPESVADALDVNPVVDNLNKDVENVVEPIENVLKTENPNDINVVPQNINENNVVPELNSVSANSNISTQVNNDLPIIGQTVVPQSNSQDLVQNVDINLNNDAVANPLIDDNVLPNLEVQVPEKVVQDSGANMPVNVTPEPRVVDSVVNNETSNQGEVVASNDTNSLETQVIDVPKTQNISFEVEKDEFLKLCGDLFDKIIEKIKNS